MDFSEITPLDIISEVPPSLKEAFIQFDADNMLFDEVGGILAGSQFSGVTLKGGGRFAGDLWQAVKSEASEFLCAEGGKYDPLRKNFTKLTKENKTLVVSNLSVVVAGFLGVQAGLVAPLILWILMAAAKVGHHAFCAAVLKQPPTATA